MLKSAKTKHDYEVVCIENVTQSKVPKQMQCNKYSSKI